MEEPSAEVPEPPTSFLRDLLCLDWTPCLISGIHSAIVSLKYVLYWWVVICLRMGSSENCGWSQPSF